MKRLLIIGAGKFGREVYAWASQSRDNGTAWEIAGFLDGRSKALEGFPGYPPIISSAEEYAPGADDVFVCAIGSPADKVKYTGIIESKGGTFVNVVHPSVVFGHNVKLGKGIILCPQAVVSSDVTIGDHAHVNLGSIVAHDVVVGPYCQINSNATLSGGVVLGRAVEVSSNAVFLPGAVAEDDSFIGAGSVVLKRVGAGQRVFGAPAKPVRVPVIGGNG